MLESLTLSSENADGQPLTSVLPAVFSDQTPRLRKLAIQSFSSWPGNRFANLTHLSLHKQPEMNRFSLAQFLDFLQDSPHLEELALVKAGPEWDDIMSPAVPHEAIPLPYLRILEIGDWPSVQIVTAFLSYLILPEKLDMSVWSHRSFDFNNNELSILFPPGSSRSELLRAVTRIRITYAPNTASYVQLIRVNGGTLDLRGSLESSQYLSLCRGCNLDKV